MWYVIQTKSGDENDLKELLKALIPPELCNDCFVPLYEEVWRKGGTGHISIKRLFPGYLFIDTPSADEVFSILKDIPRFTRLLGMPERDGSNSFIRVTDEEMGFLSTILKDGVMKVSFIRMCNKSNRIESIKGPLAAHASRITKIDIPHRRAIVKTDLFGQCRRIKFGLWTDKDPILPALIEEENIDVSSINKTVVDIGIHPGDKVVDDLGVYGDLVMEVIKVNPVKRTITVKAKMFGSEVGIELFADGVRNIRG